MKLKELFSPLILKEFSGEDVMIRGISHSSRDVKEGDLFVALRGRRFDGHSFINVASEKGAVAFLAEEKVVELIGRNYGIVDDTREALGILASHYYKRPCNRVTLLGVTGTNGKTTTTYLLESILKTSGKEVGVIGTINSRFKEKIIVTDHTTPESLDIQQILKRMVDEGVTHCVMEVSSHAIAMKRLVGCSFKAAVFTNLSHDHLDFHNDMDSYFETKASFFTSMIDNSDSLFPPFSVVNIDDKRGFEIAKRLRSKVITYGRSEGNVRPEQIHILQGGIEGSLCTPSGKLEIKSKLIGEFNLYNIMAAVGVGIGLGLPLSDIGEGIDSLKAVKGRMERLLTKDNSEIVIDYAHTPSALECVLGALETMKKGRIITVFGCGGERDRGKRPLMGQISAEKSDVTILTSDNPRNEDPLKIIQDIERGMKGMGATYYVEPDRGKAIEMAISLGEEGDIILIAGKGHEDYQIIGDRVIRFSDSEEVKRVLNSRELMI